MAQTTDPLLSNIKSIPKDAQIIDAIVKDEGITDYEDRIINRLLEFVNKYAGNIIDDAQRLANHSNNKKTIDVQDVALAISQQSNKNFITTPDKELTAIMAKSKNTMPLPQIKSSSGMRLPPDRYSLIACNYRLKSPSKKPRNVNRNITTLSSNAVNKGSGSITSLNKPSPITSIVTKANTTTIVSKPSSSTS
ncbi:transcription initiation factor TFIID subunit 9B-like isoform X1 [Argiope bruennichi]|uniref:transcription initiation factor TFIID subunit 9B-like isoform X1 n=1 Tax=Argiope bruennichi TaxID=94029 RepID=UPI00249437E1|nr:transcription initiation factor TFIID subunit 9B-like isoform X1 [Argiope bruennichi]